jgi:uncharacterized protein (DUF58 family)
VAEKLLDDEFLARLEKLQLVSKRIVAGALKGERRSRRRGHSTEFADYRPYVAGDDLRHVDWNIYGRLDKLFLKVFLEEEDLRLNILIDGSPSMKYGEPEKFTYAKKIATALGYIGLVNQDRVSIGTFSSRLRPVFGPARGRRQSHRLLDTMQELAPETEGLTDLAQSCKDFTTQGSRSGILIFVTDFFDRSGFESALRHLLASGGSTEIFVFHVLSPQEIEPDLTGDVRLVDVEDGITADVTISAPLLRQYKKTVESFRADIQAFCSARGMSYVFTSTDVPFDELVLTYLRQRGLLR